MKRAAASAAEHLGRCAETIVAVDAEAVTAMCDTLWQAWKEDRTIFVMGNGGSASNASHIACDLTKQTMMPGHRPMRVVSLTDNVALISAWGNDAGFATVFAEQIRALGRTGDLLLSVSCSGNSPNLIAAVDEARARGMRVLALGGLDGGRVREKADVYVHVPSDDYGHVESSHLAIQHCLTTLLQERARAFVTASRAVDVTKPPVILDRDGVINCDLPGGIRCWEDFSFLPGSLEALAELKRRGHRVVIVTNQANVGRGELSPVALDHIHRRMVEAIIRAGGAVDRIYACTHRPQEGCGCRKPSPGLLLRAAAELGFDLAQTYVIGDHSSDIGAARGAGARSVLVLSGRTATLLEGEGPVPDLIAPDLRAAVDLLSPDSPVDRTYIGRPDRTPLAAEAG